MEGEGEMYGKGNIETYIIICKIDNQWEFAVCPREHKQGLCTKPGVGGSGMGWERTYVHLWLIHVEV